MSQRVAELVDNWLQLDHDDKTRMEILNMVKDHKEKELEYILDPKNMMSFGTAGLRSQIGAGYNKMNTVTIMQTSQGLIEYLKQFDDYKNKGICICHDSRHYSDVFGDITAGVAVAADIKTYYFKDFCPTSFASFFTQYFGCVAGVMITASHNCSQDNGYKVYGMNCGIQILSPHDVNIKNLIAQNMNIRPETYKYKQYLSSKYQNYVELNMNSQVLKDYYTQCGKLSFNKQTNDKLLFKPAYSAMFGVGYKAFRQMLPYFNIKDESVVFIQPSCTPDPDFGGIKQPNPENVDNMMYLAKQVPEDVNIIIANDPDADRVALIEKVDGKWNTFHGNEIGNILASYVLTNTDNLENRLVATSTVSSTLLSQQAKKHGAHYEEVLTGFKYLGNLNKNSGRLMVFGCEESIGYCCGCKELNGLITGDKDGISSACMILECVNWIYKQGKTVTQHLDELYKQYGYHVFGNCSIVVSSMDEVPKLIHKFFKEDENGKREYVKNIGEFKINRIRDLKLPGYDSQDGIPKLPMSNSEMITIWCDNVTFTLRPSGTESKCKVYLEVESKQNKQHAIEEMQRFKKEVSEFMQIKM